MIVGDEDQCDYCNPPAPPIPAPVVGNPSNETKGSNSDLVLQTGLGTNSCNMYTCTMPPPANYDSGNGNSGYNSPNYGWQSPDAIFGNIDLGMLVISGSFQMGFASNGSSPATITNGATQIGPLEINQYELTSYTEQTNLGLGIKWNEPGIHVSTQSSFDLGKVRLNQTTTLNLRIKDERIIPLAVLAGGYEAVLLLLRGVGPGVFEPAFP